MEYDFKLINEFCTELGFKSVIHSSDWLEVELGEDAFLCFQNSEIAADCLIGFRDTPWHYHNDLYVAFHHREFLWLPL